MASNTTSSPSEASEDNSLLRPPRVWPAVLIVAVQLAVMFGSAWWAPGTTFHFIGLVWSPLLAALLFLIWWLGFSRLPMRTRLLGVLFTALLFTGVAVASHASIAIALVVYCLTGLLLAIACSLALTGGIAWSRRRWMVAGAIGLVVLPWTLVRVDGLDGSLNPEFSLRWATTAEEEFLARRSREGSATIPLEAAIPPEAAGALQASPGDWPRFRGPAGDSRVEGVSIGADWAQDPPRQLWRQSIGPGWSSFAVVGGLCFTQEQRGTDELVSCYQLEDGREIWVQRIPTRFEETIGGAGPRATPTFDAGHLFTLGATGKVQCLEARTGEVVWARSLDADVGAETPPWGFASSPLVLDDRVIVFAGGGAGKSVVAYDRKSGALGWSGGEGTHGYSSVHLANLGGVDQLLALSNLGLEALSPANGSLLWENRWDTGEQARVVQPLVIGSDSVIIGTGYGYGARRLRVTFQDAKFAVEEVWTARTLKPYFNDFVYDEGHCYGFDGRIFTCISSDDGARRWKGGRYGHGQVLLVVDSKLLVVLSESGEIVLLKASPAGHEELGRIPGVPGKTWNHPVIVGRRLLVRNGSEMACYQLPSPL